MSLFSKLSIDRFERDFAALGFIILVIRRAKAVLDLKMVKKFINLQDLENLITKREEKGLDFQGRFEKYLAVMWKLIDLPDKCSLARFRGDPCGTGTLWKTKKLINVFQCKVVSSKERFLCEIDIIFGLYLCLGFRILATRR